MYTYDGYIYIICHDKYIHTYTHTFTHIHVHCRREVGIDADDLLIDSILHGYECDFLNCVICLTRT